MSNVAAVSTLHNPKIDSHEAHVLACFDCKSVHLGLVRSQQDDTRIILTFWCDECSEERDLTIEPRLLNGVIAVRWTR